MQYVCEGYAATEGEIDALFAGIARDGSGEVTYKQRDRNAAAARANGGQPDQAPPPPICGGKQKHAPAACARLPRPPSCLYCGHPVQAGATWPTTSSTFARTCDYDERGELACGLSGASPSHVSRNQYCTVRSKGHSHALCRPFRSRRRHMQALQHDPLGLVSTK